MKPFPVEEETMKLSELIRPYYGVSERAINLVEKLAKLLDEDEEKQKAYYENAIDGMREALKEVDPGIPHSMQKDARLLDASVRYANQLAYHLFLEEKLTDELADELRKLPSVDTVADIYEAFKELEQKKIDYINSLQQEVMDERKDIDLFTAVILGNTREEAEAKMQEMMKGNAA